MDSATSKNPKCRRIRNITIFPWFCLLFWIPRTNSKNAILLKISTKTGNFAESATKCVEFAKCKVCEFHLHLQTRLHLRDPWSTIYIRSLLNPQQNQCATTFTLLVFVRWFHWNFLGGICLNFWACLKICLWNPGTQDNTVLKLCAYPVQSLAS